MSEVTKLILILPKIVKHHTTLSTEQQMKLEIEVNTY